MCSCQKIKKRDRLIILQVEWGVVCSRQDCTEIDKSLLDERVEREWGGCCSLCPTNNSLLGDHSALLFFFSLVRRIHFHGHAFKLQLLHNRIHGGLSLGGHASILASIDKGKVRQCCHCKVLLLLTSEDLYNGIACP